MGRFSSDTDYSQTFITLYDQNRNAVEAAARRVDAERESVLAAKDSLIFTKWQEGKISGGQLMAHIRARQNATSYDRAQQLKWKEAAIKYGDVISDERAEAKFAETENISMLIAHYAGRLSAAKRGTPERRELAQRLQTLKATRDSDNIRKKSRKIARAIERGDMNTQDLINFYKQELPGLKGDLRESVLDTLVQLRTKRRDENFEVAMQKIDNKLGTGHMTPQDAAKQKMDVLKKFNVQGQDKVGYQKWIQQINQLRAMPDPAAVQQLDFDLAAGNIDPDDYLAAINQWADDIAPFDLEAAWALRTEAQTFLEKEATPLDDPGALGFGPDGRRQLSGDLGTPGGPSGGGGSRGFSGTVQVVQKLRGNAIKFITQMDGSAYSNYNCTMASAAMLAHAMGYKGLTGADVRAGTGDRSGGTTLAQASSALKASGVDGLRLSYENRIEFQGFKQRLMNGAPASLSGWNGDIPSQFNSSGIIAGHNVFVAGYNEKKKAFLVLDPAKGNDAGTWWPERILEDFGWGGQRHGQALFAPKGTVDAKTLARSVGTKIKHINVNAKPTKPNSPPMTQFDPGTDVNGKLNGAIKSQLANQKERLADAGITEEQRLELTTNQKVEALIDERAEGIANLQQMLDRVMETVEAGGGEFEGEIELLGTGEILGRDDIASIQRQLIYLYDGQEVLYNGAGAKAKAREQNDNRRSVLVGAALLNSLENQYTTNVQTQEINRNIAALAGAESPTERQSIFDEIAAGLNVIGTLNDEGGEDEEGEDINTEADQQAADVDSTTVASLDEELNDWDALIDVLDGDHESMEDMVEAISALMPSLDFAQDDDGLAFLESLTRVYAEQGALETEESGFIMLPSENGEHQLVIVPMEEAQTEDPENPGQFLDILVPDLAALGEEWVANIAEMGFDAASLPMARMGGVGGVERIPVVPDMRPYSGVEFLVWGTGEGEPDNDSRDTLAALGIERNEINEGQPLNELQIAAITTDPVLMEDMRSRGQVERTPWPVLAVEFGGKTWFLDKMDTEQGLQVMWYEGNLPYVGRVNPDDERDHFWGGLFGAELKNNKDIWIDYTPDEIDDSSTGNPFIDIGITAQQGRDDIEANPDGVPEVLYARDPENPGEVIRIGLDDKRHYMNPESVTMNEFLAERQRKMNDAADLLTSLLPAEEAAEIVDLTEPELRQKSIDFGINYEASELVASFPGGPKASPEQAILDEMDIRVGSPPDDAVGPPPQFDHLQAARSGALGVAKANRIARETRAAAAAASVVDLASAASIPKITAPRANTSLPGGTGQKKDFKKAQAKKTEDLLAGFTGAKYQGGTA